MTYFLAQTPKPDWLTVTFSDEDFCPNHLNRFLTNNYDRIGDGDMYQVGSNSGTPGKIRFAKARRRYSVSASGAALDCMRLLNHEDEFLGLLSDFPHNVTRLDLAFDVQKDMAREMRKLLKAYSKGVRLQHRGKLLKPVRMDEERSDGSRSGSIYFGERGDTLTLRVYDKTLERLKRSGMLLDDNYTRYEFTFGRDYKGVTLADYSDPLPLFWKHAAQFLRKPSGIAEWVPREFIKPKFTKSDRTPHERIEARAQSPAIEGYFQAAANLGVSTEDALGILKRLYENMAADDV